MSLPHGDLCKNVTQQEWRNCVFFHSTLQRPFIFSNTLYSKLNGTIKQYDSSRKIQAPIWMCQWKKKKCGSWKAGMKKLKHRHQNCSAENGLKGQYHNMKTVMLLTAKQ